MITTAPQIVDFSANSLVTPENETENIISSLSVWKAFQSGMQILQRYANRSPVDIHAIAKSNLQVLHQSLSYDKQYARNIDSIRRDSAKNGLPILRRLYSDQGLNADLLSLQDGASMNLVALPQRYAMYLLVSGSAQLGTDNAGVASVQHWWNRIGSKNQKNYLRTGTVITCSTQQANTRLTARDKNCLLLRVHTPLVGVPCKMAS